MKRTCTIALLVLTSIFTIDAQDKDKHIETAPLPTAILTAQKIFVTNAGAADEVYDVFYSEMKSWGRYQLVGSPEEADLTLEFSFGSQGEAPKVYTNPANLRTYSYTVNKLRLVFYEPKTRTAIWSGTETPEGARLEKNARKNTVKAVKKMVASLKRRMEASKK